MNGNRNLSAEDVRFVRHLTDTYNDVVQRNRSGEDPNTLRSIFAEHANGTVEDWYRATDATLKAGDVQRLYDQVDRAFSQALVP